MKFLIKEATLLMAFVILGGMLLLCVWISNQMNESFLKEFKNSKISIVIAPGSESEFRVWTREQPDILETDIYYSHDNKARLGALYPELRNIIAPLESRFFPSSAVLTVKNPEKTMAALKEKPELSQAQMLHAPPDNLTRLMNVLTFIFSGLWLLTLSLLLYFNLEKLAIQEEAKWSLLKMLGAKSYRLFLPLWSGQILRISIASISAIFLTIVAARQIRGLFAWNWGGVSWITMGIFFTVAIAMTSAIAFTLFSLKYRRISLG